MTSSSSTPSRRAAKIRNLVASSQYQSPFSNPNNFVSANKQFKRFEEQLEKKEDHHLEIDLVKTFKEVHCSRCFTLIRSRTQFMSLSMIRPFVDGRLKSLNIVLCYVCLGEIVKEITPEEIERQTKERLLRQVMNAV